MAIILYHGSGNPNLTANDITIVGGNERKQGSKYGGFYAVDHDSYKNAVNYARMNGGEPTMYEVSVREDAHIWDKPGDITRLGTSDIQKWLDQGIDIVRGKDFRGQLEYAIINRDVVTGMKALALAESRSMRDFISIVEQAASSSLNVYHGTEGSPEPHDGMFFSTDADFASNYGSVHRYEIELGRIFDSLDAAMVEPLLPLHDSYDDEDIETIEAYMERSSDTWEMIETAVSSIRSKGFDTMIVYEGGVKNYLVFRKERVTLLP